MPEVIVKYVTSPPTVTFDEITKITQRNRTQVEAMTRLPKDHPHHLDHGYLIKEQYLVPGHKKIRTKRWGKRIIKNHKYYAFLKRMSGEEDKQESGKKKGRKLSKNKNVVLDPLPE